MRWIAMAWMLTGFGCLAGPRADAHMAADGARSVVDGVALLAYAMTPGPCEGRHDAVACAPSLSWGERRDNAAENREISARNARENAEIRATTAMLARERAAERPRPRSTCLVADVTPADVRRSADHLDREMISQAVADVKSDVMSCRARSAANGQVWVSITVAREGCVSAVTVESTPDPELGDCVATAIAQASFATTRRGGSFRYPFVF